MRGGNAQRILETAQRYFAACDATQERHERKDGSIAVRQVPYTMAGLAAALEMDRAALEEALRKGRNTALRRALRVAAARVEQHTVERALLGELNSTMATMLLRDWGYGAQGESTGALTVTLEDKEDFGR